MVNIILASASPRRSELLRQIGLVGFRIQASDIEETLDESLAPEEIAWRISREKARAVSKHARPDEIVIAADTIVCCGKSRLGKPKDKLDAAKMLKLLSGNRHQVYTGVTVAKDTEIYTETETTQVYFRKLEDREIEAYVNTAEPMDKAGAYGIQGLGAIFVERIEGDYYNVMGLPVCRLVKMLKRLGVRLF